MFIFYLAPVQIDIISDILLTYKSVWKNTIILQDPINILPNICLGH